MVIHALPSIFDVLPYHLRSLRWSISKDAPPPLFIPTTAARHLLMHRFPIYPSWTWNIVVVGCSRLHCPGSLSLPSLTMTILQGGYFTGGIHNNADFCLLMSCIYQCYHFFGEALARSWQTFVCLLWPQCVTGAHTFGLQLMIWDQVLLSFCHNPTLGRIRVYNVDCCMHENLRPSLSSSLRGPGYLLGASRTWGRKPRLEESRELTSNRLAWSGD